VVQELKAGTKKFLVGLTGTFGSGKSTIAGFFEKYGAGVIDSDRLAHEVLLKNSSVFESIRKNFPEVPLNAQGDFDRKGLAKIVFTDKAKRKTLESLIHPYVFSRIREEVSRSSAKIVMIEMPLLFETGYENKCHKVIAVSTDPEVLEGRLSKKGFNRQDIAGRNAAQWSAEEKMKKADFIIHNSKDIKTTCSQVEEVWNQLCVLSKGAN
jgi:dephospho-CoA kinase